LKRSMYTFAENATDDRKFVRLLPRPYQTAWPEGSTPLSGSGL